MKPMKPTAVVAAIAIAGVMAISVAGAASTAPTKISAKLTAKAEIPAQVVKNAKGSGSFTGTLTGRKLVWKLTLSHLSGAAVAALREQPIRLRAGRLAPLGVLKVPRPQSDLAVVPTPSVYLEIARCGRARGGEP